MLRTLLLLTTLSLATTVLAQGVRIVPKLRAGDVFRLEVIRTRESSIASPQDGKSTARIDARVLTVTPEASTLEWESTDNQIIPGLKPVIKLTSDGEVAGLLNEADVLAKIQSVVDMVHEEVRDMPAANRQSAEAVVQLMTPAIIISTVMRDARIYFGLDGTDVGEPFTVETTQPNPINGAAVAATRSVRLESATADAAVVVTTTTYDSAAVVRASLELMERIGEPIPPGELAKYAQLQTSDEARFVFDRVLGLMREVTINRRVSLGGQTRLERTEIRLASRPQR